MSEEGGGVDGWTEEQSQTNLPLQLIEVGGFTMHYCTGYVPDKLNF